MRKARRDSELVTTGRRAAVGPVMALVLSLALSVVGACVCISGQALGALLLPTCQDYGRATLSAECQQPVTYARWGLRTAIAGVTASVASGVWLVRRKRAARSG